MSLVLVHFLHGRETQMSECSVWNVHWRQKACQSHVVLAAHTNDHQAFWNQRRIWRSPHLMTYPGTTQVKLLNCGNRPGPLPSFVLTVGICSQVEPTTELRSCGATGWKAHLAGQLTEHSGNGQHHHLEERVLFVRRHAQQPLRPPWPRRCLHPCGSTVSLCLNLKRINYTLSPATTLTSHSKPCIPAPFLQTLP